MARSDPGLRKLNHHEGLKVARTDVLPFVPWQQSRNNTNAEINEPLHTHVREFHEYHDQSTSFMGWRTGGGYTRELTQAARQAITAAAPYHDWRLFQPPRMRRLAFPRANSNFE